MVQVAPCIHGGQVATYIHDQQHASDNKVQTKEELAMHAHQWYRDISNVIPCGGQSVLQPLKTDRKKAVADQPTPTQMLFCLLDYCLEQVTEATAVLVLLGVLGVRLPHSELPQTSS